MVDPAVECSRIVGQHRKGFPALVGEQLDRHAQFLLGMQLGNLVRERRGFAARATLCNTSMPDGTIANAQPKC